MDCSTVVEVILEADQVSWTNQLAMGKVTCYYLCSNGHFVLPALTGSTTCVRLLIYVQWLLLLVAPQEALSLEERY